MVQEDAFNALNAKSVWRQDEIELATSLQVPVPQPLCSAWYPLIFPSKLAWSSFFSLCISGIRTTVNRITSNPQTINCSHNVACYFQFYFLFYFISVLIFLIKRCSKVLYFELICLNREEPFSEVKLRK